MSSGRKSNSNKSTIPAPPTPTSEWYQENGVLKSQRVYDDKKKGYVSDVFMTPQEQALEKNATQFLGDTVTGAQQAFTKWTDPAQQQQALQAYMDPQKRALNDSFNQSMGQFNTAASAGGMRGSVGAANYATKQLEAERARGLSDIEQSGQMMQFQLPGMALSPYMDAMNLFNSAYTGQNQAQAQNLEPSFQGSQAASNFNLQNYNNQLAYAQLKNQQNQPSGGGGFLSRLFGGF